MWRGWRNLDFGKKRQNEISTSDEELDSDFENDEGDEEVPTLVTLDDGKGGIRHIKVIQKDEKETLSRNMCVQVKQPVESQSEIVRNVSEETSSDGGPAQKLSSAGSETPKFGLGDLVKRELKGKHFLNIEPHSES